MATPRSARLEGLWFGGVESAGDQQSGVHPAAALPAFFAPGVPAGLRVIAAVSVLLSITAVALMLTPARRSTAAGT